MAKHKGLMARIVEAIQKADDEEEGNWFPKLQDWEGSLLDLADRLDGQVVGYPEFGKAPGFTYDERTPFLAFFGHAVAQHAISALRWGPMAKLGSPIEEQMFYGLIVAGWKCGGGVEIKYNGHERLDATLGWSMPERLIIEVQPTVGEIHPDFVVTLEDIATETFRKSIAIECDGHDFHEKTKQQASCDKKRDRMLTARGLQVARFTGSEIHDNPLKCAQWVTASLRQGVERDRTEAKFREEGQAYVERENNPESRRYLEKYTGRTLEEWAALMGLKPPEKKE